MREGSARAFMLAAPPLGRREVFVGAEGRRTGLDYTEAIEYLYDSVLPDAEKIVLVQDNLNTHEVASLYKRFAPEKTRRLARKLEIHYTPKHGSWLNIAEIEISLLSRSALKPRITDLEQFNQSSPQSPATETWRPAPSTGNSQIQTHELN